MALDDFKTGVERDLKAALGYIKGKRKTLPDSNLFRPLTDSHSNRVDVNYNYNRLETARLVEIGSLENRQDFKKLLRKVEFKECFHNAYQLSWDLYWDYCEGSFIDQSLWDSIDHAWNKTPEGLYVDITGDAQPYWDEGSLPFKDRGVYVCYYEIDHVRLRELQLIGGTFVGPLRISQIDWFSKHDPDRIKPGKHYFDMKKLRRHSDE